MIDIISVALTTITVISGIMLGLIGLYIVLIPVGIVLGLILGLIISIFGGSPKDY